MSHFLTIVLVPHDCVDVEDKVSALLAPYDENGEFFADGSRWDWWVIGGRWNGHFEENFDPDMDPRNYEPCPYCGGTGSREMSKGMRWNQPHRQEFNEGKIVTVDGPVLYPVKEGATGCNACGGTGFHRKFDVHFEVRSSNILPVSQIPVEKTPCAVVTPDGRWHEKGRVGWWGSTIPDELGFGETDGLEWAVQYKGLLEANPDCLGVVVDCHV